MKRNFEIDETIASLLPALTDDEREGLETQIRSRGHIEPLVTLVLRDTNRRILGDGHNRLGIADRLKLPYATRDVYVDDLNEAIEWVVTYQLGRRNVTPETRAYLRGKEYLKEKQPRGGAKVQNAPSGNTAEKLAEKHGVSPDTIKRDAEFAAGADTLPPEAKAKVLSGQATVTKAEVATGIFCRRCKRIGDPIKNCPMCAEEREKARKRAEKKAAPKVKAPKKKPEWPAFDNMVKKLHRLLADKGVPVLIREKFLSAIDEVRAWQKSSSTG